MTDKYKTIEKKLSAKTLDTEEQTVEITVKNKELSIDKTKYFENDKEIQNCKIVRGYLYDTIELPREIVTGVKLKDDKDLLSVAVEENIEKLLIEKKDLEVLEVDANKVFGKAFSADEYQLEIQGGVVQLVERWPSVPVVVGSSPAASAKKCPSVRNW
nr:13413_t:CDS:2 [Entrophospora candida]